MDLQTLIFACAVVVAIAGIVVVAILKGKDVVLERDDSGSGRLTMKTPEQGAKKPRNRKSKDISPNP